MVQFNELNVPDRATLKRLGISRQQAINSLKVAAIPEEVFERYFNQCKTTRTLPTRQGLFRFAAESEQNDSPVPGT